MIFSKKFVAALIMLVQLSQAMPRYTKSVIANEDAQNTQTDSLQHQAILNNDKPAVVTNHSHDNQNDNLKPQVKPKNDKSTDSNNVKYPGSNEKFNPQVVLDLTNKLRAQNGKKPLELRMELVKDAYEHTVYMESINKLTHDRLPQDDMRKSLESKGLKTGNLAENIGKGSLSDKDAYTSWSGSDGHKENMLGDYDYMGVAISGPYTAQTFAGKA